MASEDRLPTKEEIKQLPRWARVAFAVRCAERVRPLFTHAWPDAPREQIDAVDRAISIAKARALNGGVGGGTATRAAGSAAGLAAGLAATPDVVDVGTAAYTAAYAAAAATSAVDAATNAADAAAGRVAAVAHATMAADAAGRAYAACAAARRAGGNAMRGDLESLRAMAEREGWTDKTPVDADALGPLWPDGEPVGWPEIGEAVQAAELARMDRQLRYQQIENAKLDGEGKKLDNLAKKLDLLERQREIVGDKSIPEVLDMDGEEVIAFLGRSTDKYEQRKPEEADEAEGPV